MSAENYTRIFFASLSRWAIDKNQFISPSIRKNGLLVGVEEFAKTTATVFFFFTDLYSLDALQSYTVEGFEKTTIHIYFGSAVTVHRGRIYKDDS